MLVWTRAAIAACLILVATGTQQNLLGDRVFTAQNIRLADVGQSDATGGIIALYPRAADAQAMAMPGGEPREDLHVTLVYTGDDLGGLGDDEIQRSLETLTAAHPDPITAQVFGHAVFNPNSTEVHPAAVYLVGDSPDLAPFRQQVMESFERLFPLPAQHEPWIPHVTAGNWSSDTVLTYTGPIVFDRIGLSWSGHTTFFSLGDS